tara:strand:- start:225150 stop:226346 length:1197 start_codon:yes stop_codon:yes gene_type:complete
MKFAKTHKDGAARAGIIETAHGNIETPAFIPVGTKATIKGVHPHEVKDIGAQVVLANTYHLFLQPGDELVKKHGGLHKFMNWAGPIVTDSGGFQVFSLGAGFDKSVSKMGEKKEVQSRTPAVFDEAILNEHGKLAIVDDEGVSFTSHIDGTLYRFTPERSVEIQHNLGADIFFAFDECTSPDADYDYQREAMNRTHKWAKRSLDAHRRNLDSKQAIFGIVQGGRHTDLREESSKTLGDMNFDGYGIGGSFSKEDLGPALDAGLKHLPEDKPRHLLGIGEPADMFEGVARGIDTFDCVAATRLARNGTAYTLDGPIDLRKEPFKEDMNPIEKDLPDSPSAPYTRAYLAHLFRAKEMLGGMIVSQHNLYFILKLVDDMREAIKEGRFEEFRKEFCDRYYV